MAYLLGMDTQERLQSLNPLRSLVGSLRISMFLFK